MTDETVDAIARLVDPEMWSDDPGLSGETLVCRRLWSQVQAQRIINHLRAQGLLVPNDWVAVPKEPTAEMRRAAAKAMSPGHRPTPDRVSCSEKHAIRYAAMLAAAPKPGEGK